MLTRSRDSLTSLQVGLILKLNQSTEFWTFEIILVYNISLLHQIVTVLWEAETDVKMDQKQDNLPISCSALFQVIC